MVRVTAGKHEGCDGIVLALSPLKARLTVSDIDHPTGFIPLARLEQVAEPEPEPEDAEPFAAQLRRLAISADESGGALSASLRRVANEVDRTLAQLATERARAEREPPEHRDLTDQDRRRVVELAVLEWVGDGHLTSTAR